MTPSTWSRRNPYRLAQDIRIDPHSSLRSQATPENTLIGSERRRGWHAGENIDLDVHTASAQSEAVVDVDSTPASVTTSSKMRSYLSRNVGSIWPSTYAASQISGARFRPICRIQREDGAPKCAVFGLAVSQLISYPVVGSDLVAVSRYHDVSRLMEDLATDCPPSPRHSPGDESGLATLEGARVVLRQTLVEPWRQYPGQPDRRLQWLARHGRLPKAR